MSKELFVVEAICPILHIGKTTVYKLIRSGQLSADKICGKWQVKVDDLEDFIERQRHQL